MPSPHAPFARAVFINCPFDDEYWPLFEAMVFTVVACGFEPRCALEEVDSGAVRLQKILRIIRACRLGIHDLSRIELAPSNRLPRFNMPFELGLDIASREFGARTLKKKRHLVLDAEPYRYQAFISDISGQDIRCHEGSPDRVVDVIRNWLRTMSHGRAVAGPVAIKRQFRAFTLSLPENCARNGLDQEDLLFVEYVELATLWLATANAKS